MSEETPVIRVSRFAASLARPTGKKRMEALFADPDVATRVAELSVQDLYLLVKEIGLDDAAELVSLATPDQVQAFVDLDAWDRDQFLDAQTRPWLAALMEAGPEKLTQIWRELDPELTALLLASWTRIYTLGEEEVPDSEEPPFYPTPDRFFMVKITASEPEDVKLVERLLDHLYRVDAELARHTLRSAASEDLAYLHEQCYRFRANRMQELGYVEFTEALEVYRPLDPKSLRIGEKTAEQGTGKAPLPALFAGKALHQGFLARVLAQVVEPEEARRLEGALVTLVNRVLAADHISPGDLASATDGAARAVGTLTLGLETVSGGDVARALAALRTISLSRLHRAGCALTHKLTDLARALSPRARRADDPFLAVVLALTEARPRFARLLDDKPSAGTRAFASVDDVKKTTAALAELAAQITLVYDVLRADPAELGPITTLGDVGRTAVVHAALGHGAQAEPLTSAEVQTFAEGAFQDGRLKAETRITVESAFGQEYFFTIAGWMGDLERAADPRAPRMKVLTQ